MKPRLLLAGVLGWLHLEPNVGDELVPALVGILRRHVSQDLWSGGGTKAALFAPRLRRDKNPSCKYEARLYTPATGLLRIIHFGARFLTFVALGKQTGASGVAAKTVVQR